MGDERFSVPAPKLGRATHVWAHLRDGKVVRCGFEHKPLPDIMLSEAALAVRDAIARHVEHGDADLAAIPVDLSGVPEFQRRVLEALHRTRAGETLTYGELAALAGSPGAARAVGTAMARNPIALIVPCHRVVQANGAGPGGYSGLGGVDTKRALLRLERAIPQRTLEEALGK